MYKLKDASTESRNAAVQKLRALSGMIPSLLTLHVGADVASSDQNYDVGLIATFADRAGLQAFQTHASYLPVQAYMQAHCSHIAVVASEK